MKLGIISATPHYRTDTGTWVGHGATVREISQLATLFDSVRHLGFFYESGIPSSALPYTSDRVHFTPVTAVGGKRCSDKSRIIRQIPSYARAIRELVAASDMIHIRAPASISMLAIVLHALNRKPKPHWIKYAGNWSPKNREAASYTVQRRLLRRPAPRTIVTVNGLWQHQPRHVVSFLNPCLTQAELDEGGAAAAAKSLEFPVRLLFVGRLDTAKGALRAIHVRRKLEALSIPSVLDLAGDSPSRDHVVTAAKQDGDRVRIHGELSREDLGKLYRLAHFFVLPTQSSEGWPKVISEAMAYGGIPICSDVSSIAQYLGALQIGQTHSFDDLDGFAASIRRYVERPEQAAKECAAAARAARSFSYAAYLDAVRALTQHLVDPSAPLPRWSL